jgi:hypothetical protein
MKRKRKREHRHKPHHHKAQASTSKRHRPLLLEETSKYKTKTKRTFVPGGAFNALTARKNKTNNAIIFLQKINFFCHVFRHA